MIVSDLDIFAYDRLILDIIEPKITFTILFAVSIGVSFSHSIKYKKFPTDLLVDPKGFKETASAIWEVFQTPIPMIGSYVILKLFVMAKLGGYDHLKDLTTFESLALIFVAAQIFIASAFDLYKKGKDLRVRTNEATPLQQP